ncbi:MAG TPA: hypothetical protein VE646_11445 [Actinomycetota bacterium]|jgi:type II secretory pathway pseudopilin PulG|nr:hypothetical protein [Actinomycetota bacterium]
MAIKGKSKTRSRRAVTPGPRPVYVPVKKPLYARREIQVAVVVLLVIAAAGGIWYGVAHSRTQARAREQQRLMRTVASAYQVEVNQALSGVGQPTPPVGFSAMPGLKPDIQGLRKGSVDPSKATADAGSFAQTASKAADAFDKIDATSLVSGKGITDQVFVLNLLNSRTRMEEALKLYGNAARLLGDAATATGGTRTELLQRASSVTDVASGLFAEGYNDYLNAQDAAGILQPTLPSSGSPVGGSPLGGGS